VAEVLAVLDRTAWGDREHAHAERVDAATAGHRARQARGIPHPGEDFLFTYYPFTVSALRRWHPGPDVALAQAADRDRASWRFYRTVGADVVLDRAAYLQRRGDTVRFVRDLLTHTAGRPLALGCFALHEWAMVYRLEQQHVRHRAWPLRLGSEDTDRVVDAAQIRCTHFDAFRFFTEPARPLNQVGPTRARQVELEQPGCLHAGMDLYKWAMKLAPAVPSELAMDCFDLARTLRTLDMRASPYDVRSLGYDPIRVETPEGRAEFVTLQREYAGRGQALRARLVAACDRVLGVG
jgi:hypothetical protein